MNIFAMHKKLEQLLAFHCAPALAGIKSANLVSVQKQMFANLSALLEEYKACLRCKGIDYLAIAESARYVAVMIYRRERLEMILSDEKNMVLLSQYGYRPHDSVEAHLDYLKLRMQVKKAFPHEIGLFLGYPYEDVLGFIRNGGRHFKFSGYWKVYANARETKKLFEDYAKCSHAFCERINQGISMKKLLEAI